MCMMYSNILGNNEPMKSNRLSQNNPNVRHRKLSWSGETPLTIKMS